MEGKIVIIVERVEPAVPGGPDMAVKADVSLRNYNQACAAPIVSTLCDALGLTGSLRTMTLIEVATHNIAAKKSESVGLAITTRSDPHE